MSLPTLRTAARRAIAGPSSVRALSTSAPVLNQKKKKAPKQNVLHSPDAMPLAEAVRILRALEIANPASAYTLEMVTKMTKGGAPLRGRVALPTDPRRVSDVIVVFASPDSPAAQIAREAGAHHVGEQDLFDKILKEEIKPTKVLSTPAAIPAASKALARFLGPKGLMPAAKRGTVVDGAEIGRLIKEIGGTVDWKSDKFGIIRSRKFALQLRQRSRKLHELNWTP
jgi:large subunit ribosomal protein L1